MTINGGTVKKSAGAGSCYLQWQVNSTGLVAAQTGTLDLNAGGNSSGQFDVSAGATLNAGARAPKDPKDRPETWVDTGTIMGDYYFLLMLSFAAGKFR